MAGGKKKAAKFIKKGHLKAKLKQRNDKKRIKALKEKRKAKYEDEDGPAKKKTPAQVAADNSGRKDESDMLDDMDVDEFLNDGFLDSDAESENEEDAPVNGSDDDDDDEDDDAVMDDDAESSEEEDEDALDPRYMTSFPAFEGVEDNDDDDDDENETTEGGEPPADEDDEMPESVGRTVLTMELLAKAESECFDKHTAGGLRRLMKIFSDACRSSDAADVSKDGEIMYDIQSSAVYNRLMLNVFRKVHLTFAALVAQETDGDKVKVDERKWKKHALVIRRFFSCVCYVLSQTTGQDIQQFVLRELAQYIPYAVPCHKTANKLLRTLLKLWAKSLNTNVCMLAFVRIRDLALQMPFPFLELALKGIYIAYMRNTKFTNESTLPHHVLLGNCVVELYGLDMASSYQHAFVYIRELAIAIRKTITSPSAESFKAVLNWQFFNQLRVWTAVVSAYPSDSQLKALVYPLCQLLFAVVRLAATIRYAPLRFQCVALLQQLASASDSFVPTVSVLLEVLAMAPFSTSYRGASKGGKKAAESKLEIDLALAVKLSKSQLDDKRVHDALLSRLFELLQRDCDVYKHHIGFPELTVPLQLALAKFAQGCLVPKWKSLARGLVESVNKRADYIRAKRSNLDIAPKDVDQMDAFLKDEREQAVKKLAAAHAEELQKKLATKQQPTSKPAAAYDSDSDADADENDKSAPTPSAKKKKKTRGKKNKQAAATAPVDHATVEKVKSMSLKEFKESVAAVDQDDVVEDFAFSSDEE